MFLLAALSLSSPAAVVLGNLGADGTGGTAGVVDVGGATYWDAHSFHTGSSSLLHLQSITVGLDLSTGGPSTVTMDLYADNVGNPGSPGSILASATNTVTSPDTQTLTFDFNQTLSENTTYWAAIGGVADLRWAVSPSGHPMAQNSSGYSWLGAAFSADSRTTWTNDKTGWTENSGSISVVAVAVPEPSAALLGALGSLFLLRRRR